MFNLRIKRDPSDLDVAIARLHVAMADLPPESPEYESILENLERLTKLKTDTRRKPVDPNTILVVAGNLAGILVIVGYERANVMTSKGLGFIMKPGN